MNWYYMQFSNFNGQDVREEGGVSNEFAQGPFLLLIKPIPYELPTDKCLLDSSSYIHALVWGKLVFEVYVVPVDLCDN